MKVPTFRLQWFASVDEGRQLEMVRADEADEREDIVARIYADEKDESLWVEVFFGEHPVHLPLSTLEEAIASAKEGVHSETWYERNVHNRLEDT